MPLRANARAAVAKGPRMQYSPVPTPEGTKETYWETKAPSSEVPAMCRANHVRFAAASMHLLLAWTPGRGVCAGNDMCRGVDARPLR